MKDFLKTLDSESVLIADGAWGSYLMEKGLQQGDAPEGWILEHPDIIKEITREYEDSGSQIILTNTFGGSRIKLSRYNLDSDCFEINRKAAEITNTTTSDKTFVAGDIGPTGKLHVMGEISTEELQDVFTEQSSALQEGGAELIVIETMSDIGEMEIAIHASKKTGLPVVASMTYEPMKDGYRTVMGNSVDECIKRSLDAGADVIGANCGTGIENYTEVAKILKQETDRPLWIKANAGIPYIEGNKTIYPIGPVTYAEYIPDLLKVGVKIIGGCCGTNPLYIRHIRSKITSFFEKTT